MCEVGSVLLVVLNVLAVLFGRASRVVPVIRSSAHSLHASNALAGCGNLASRCVSTSSSRWAAATPAASLSPTVSVIVNGKKEPSPRLVQLANDITSLTLLESAELAELLKVGALWFCMSLCGNNANACFAFARAPRNFTFLDFFRVGSIWLD